jgi:hypothetical protein
MQDPVTETQENPEAVETPQNLEGDPGKVVDIFKEAAATLEYTPDTPEEAKPEEPEIEAKIEEPEPKPPKKKEKKKKDEPVTEPEEKTPVETAEEPTAEPKKSKRELFREKADAEKAYREKETKLKEREAAVQAAEAEVKAFKADPVKHLEADDPKFYEKLTQRYLNEGKSPEAAETAAIRAELAALKEKIESKHEETTSQVQNAQHAQYLTEARSILLKEEYQDARDDAEIWEKFTGRPVDIDRVIAERHDEGLIQWEKKLTPADVCEIILEDAQEHIENIGSFIEFMAGKRPELFTQSQAVATLFKKGAGTKPQKKTPPTSGKTLTQKQETASAPAPEPQPRTFASKEEMFAAVAEGLEYEEPEE